MTTAMIASVVIFIVVYALLASGKLEDTVAALLGAAAVIGLRLIDFESAMRAIDMNVIFLLVGMMTCVAILAETGFFEWVAISVAKGMKGKAGGILVMLLAVTAGLSCLLDNVTTIILMVPVTILITQLLEVPVRPFLILEAIFSNIGGTATLIGDPPNIIIGSRANLSFNDFLIHATPGILLVTIVSITVAYLLLRRKLNVSDIVRTRVTDACPALALRDRKKMYRALTVFALIMIGFFTQRQTGLEAGIIAVAGMAIMLPVCYTKTEHMLKVVEWNAVFFFIGLFIIIGAMEHNGVIDLMAKGMFHLCGDNLLLSTMVVLWGSALFSSILNNIPFVLVMIPLIQKMIINTGGTADAHNPLYWALAFGACLGGNGTIIGASANVLACSIGNRNNYRISFMDFFKWGMPFMILSIVICSIYIWLRYF